MCSLFGDDIAAPGDEDRLRVKKALASLEPQYRIMLVERYFNRRTLQSIGDAEGITREGVRRRIIKATKELRNEYENA